MRTGEVIRYIKRVIKSTHYGSQGVRFELLENRKGNYRYSSEGVVSRRHESVRSYGTTWLLRFESTLHDISHEVAVGSANVLNPVRDLCLVSYTLWA